MFKLSPQSVPKELAQEIKSIQEEKINMLSHAFGILLFLIGGVYLVQRAAQTSDKGYLFGCIVFCVTLLMVYTASTLYHSAYRPALRTKLRIFDHISIYFLIAGSYTPFILTHLRFGIGWTILIILWSMVLIGSAFKLFFTHRFNLASTIVYLIMGWSVLFMVNPILENLPWLSIVWIGIGGCSYTIGSIFYIKVKWYYNHLIWHLFVLGGSVSHYIAVYYCYP